MSESQSEAELDMFLVKSLGSWLSPGGEQGKLSILVYHRVLGEVDPMRPMEFNAAHFNRQMNLLARYFNVLPLTAAVDKLRQGSLPARAVSITFDDGYADNAETALPILQALGLPATFFIATGYLEGGRMWNDTVIEALRRLPSGKLDLSERGLGVFYLNSVQDRVSAAQRIIGLLKYLPYADRQAQVDYVQSLVSSPLPANLMLTEKQLHKIYAAGMEIGAHTVNHPILANLDQEQARWEIITGKDQLETLIGERIRLFAYPNGRPTLDYLPEHVGMVREVGFDAAVSTQWGVSNGQTDRWQLPRFTPWDITRVRFMARLLWNCRATA